MAHLRHANRALHRPEVRVCQRNIHRLQRERVPHLAPVGRDHVGGGWQPGGATELRHHFTSGEPLLCAARIFRIGQHAFKLLTDFYRLIKRPGTVRIQRDARLREALRQRGDRLCFFFTRQYTAFQLEVIKAIFFIRGFRQAHYRVRGHRFIVTHTIPVAFFVRLALVRQRGEFAVADKEQVAEHFHFAALLAVAQQGGDIDAKMLAQQIQHRGFNARDHMDSGAQIKRLQTTATRITIGKGRTHASQHIFVLAQRFTHHQRNGVLQRFTDLLPARDFTDTGMP